MSDIRVLIVVDGIFRTGEQDAGDYTFTINHLIKTLRSDPSISVDTANRNDDTFGSPPPNFPDPWTTVSKGQPFNFATTNLSVYNEIWLIGYSGSNLTPKNPISFISEAELAAVARFMDFGGGVLATGDHGGLGSAMCGLIPRVRTMRKWFLANETDSRVNFVPSQARNWPGLGAGRADTLQPNAIPNVIGDYNFDCQSDDKPQKLTLVSGTTHPLLQVPGGLLDVFPDHMHEGEVLGFGGVPSSVPWILTDTVGPWEGQTWAEYPHSDVVKPIVLATGEIIKDHSTPLTGGAPCEMGNFSADGDPTNSNPDGGNQVINTLSAYDGHAAGVGRVMTDSSFHHYIDLNLVGDPCSSIPDRNLGFKTAAGQPHLAKFEAFFLNAARWLAGPRVDAWLAVSKNSFGLDEVSEVVDNTGRSRWPSSIWLILDGISPEKADAAPTPVVTSSLLAPGIVEATVGPYRATMPAQTTTPQRIAYPIEIDFFAQAAKPKAAGGLFPAVGGDVTYGLKVDVVIAGQPFSAEGEIELVGGADPYFSNVDYTGSGVYYLSQDLRVWSVTPGLLPSNAGGKIQDPSAPAMQVANAQAQETAAGYRYVQDVLDWLNANYTDPSKGDVFELFPDQGAALSSFSSVRPNQPSPANPQVKLTTYNFAVARVRINGGSTGPKPCKVFFRAFAANSPDTDFQPSTAYRSSPASGPPEIPLLGTTASSSSDITTVPFFATGNHDGNGDFQKNTDYTAPSVNNRPIGNPNNSHGEVIYAYFGCFLNVFPTANTILVPPAPTPMPVLALLPGSHHCLVAQIAYDDAPIDDLANGITLGPQNCDKLAQRNIQVTTANDPESPETRLVPQVFDVRPSRALFGNSPWQQFATTPDELIVEWGSVPAGCEARVYWPGALAEEVVALANRMYNPKTHGLRAAGGDKHSFVVAVPEAGGWTWIPVPRGGAATGAGTTTATTTAATTNLAGLFTVQLPEDIVKGQEFVVTVRRVASRVPPRDEDPPTLRAAQHHPLPATSDQVIQGEGVSVIVSTPTAAAAGAAGAAAAAAASKIDATVPTIRSTNWRYVTGAFAVRIPVSVPVDMLPAERDLQAVLAWKLNALPAGSRWFKVLQRYLGHVTARVDGIGGKDLPFVPSPAGAVPVPHHGQGKYPDRHRGPFCKFVGRVPAVTYGSGGEFLGFVHCDEQGCERRFDGPSRGFEFVIGEAWRRQDIVEVETPEQDKSHYYRRMLDLWNRYVEDHPNANAYDLMSLKDFMKDVAFSIDGAEDNPDPGQGTDVTFGVFLNEYGNAEFAVQLVRDAKERTLREFDKPSPQFTGADKESPLDEEGLAIKMEFDEALAAEKMQDLDIVILRPRGSENVAQMDRQFCRRFRVRRAAIEAWLKFLAANHPGYRDFTLNYDNLSQLPEDGNVFDQLTIHEVNDTTGVPADFGPADESVEEPEPEDGDVVDEV
ncbi:hypothetical protein B0T26DRAFT_757182 [Lasiosphaeria miniovina]|uniref:DUF6570 domain-containing protein n=1 Tax=Lasiosphaeria miniovina TaxID=1954250 RepID=A0AA39ZTX1_9PEZI|nr:uncharacterized protein B0T26DRAFT_757182 [Lasiosphaeria miniovina]KAK0703664.1 hypothetical protein B0T26DRAFT_757182 [Lasiosphaeria miniovina]